jgi:arsenate reductase (thioredoxin)
MNILFLCTHNSARSILSEALLNHLSHTIGNGKFKAYSAGSSPRENQQPNPLAIQALKDAGIETNDLSSKSWDVFAAPDAPKMDLVVTVCDNAAAEVCPFFPSTGNGKPAKAHWGYADPSLVQGTQDVRLQAFVDTMNWIEARLRAFIVDGKI